MKNWRERLWLMDSQVEQNIDDINIQQTEAKEGDVGLINPHTHGGLLVRDNGKIDMFADYGLGFRMDPSTQTLSIFSPNLKLFYQKKEVISHDSKMTFLKEEYEEVLNLITKKGSE